MLRTQGPTIHIGQVLAASAVSEHVADRRTNAAGSPSIAIRHGATREWQGATGWPSRDGARATASTLRRLHRGFLASDVRDHDLASRRQCLRVTNRR